MPVEVMPSDSSLPRDGSTYPNLDEGAPGNKLTDTKGDNQSNNSEDSGVVDWKDPKSVVEKNRHMLESQMSCDVMFYVGEKREKLGAHKYVLMTRSDVFLHMFNESDPEKSEFDVPDISADYFWEVLRHIYCEDQKLQVISVVGILAAADRYKLVTLKNTCLSYLHNCLEISNACYLLVEVRKHDFPEEEKKIVSYIRKNAEDVLMTPGMMLLSKELLDMILNLPDLDVDEEVKRNAMDKWSKENSIREKEELHKSTPDLLDDPIQDYLYVEREDSECHRYVLDSVTSRNLFEEPDELVTPPNVEMPPNDVPDGMSTITSTTTMKSRSSVHTYSRLPSCNMWPEMEMVTRLQEVHGSGENDAKKADAISFTVDHNIYLFGFGIYGPKKEGEGRYQIDTVLTRKKRDIVLETIRIRGAGVILPVLFERPVKIDKDVPYTLEIYITGPDSHMGASGQSQVLNKAMLFKFSNPKVKNNRSNVSGGQIPRLLFLPRNK